MSRDVDGNGRESLLGISQRLPPCNIQAEQALLGALLANNQAHIRVAAFLAPEHFYDPVHARIYQSICRRIEAGQLADAVTLKAELEHSGILADAGGTSYLAQLLTAMVGIIPAGEYGRAIFDCWVRRRLIEIGETVVNGAFGGEPGLDGIGQIAGITEEIELLNEQTSAVSGPQAKTGATSYAEAVQASIERADGITAGHIARPSSTGIGGIDKVLGGGLYPDTLVYMLGLGEHGKTELALAIAESVARKAMDDWTQRKAEFAINLAAGLATPDKEPREKCPGVLFFSFDMTARQLGDRGTARMSGVPLWRLRRGDLRHEDGYALRGVADEAARMPIMIDDAGPPTLAHVRASIARFCGSRPCSLAVIDNASNIASHSGSDKLFSSFIHMTAELKRIAKAHGIPILLLMHLNSQIMHRPDPTPKRGDIPWGTQKDADTAFAVWRPILAMSKNPPSAPARLTPKGEEVHAKMVAEWHLKHERLKGVTELIPLKMREDDDGAGGKISRIVFDSGTRRFSDEDMNDT